MKKSEESKNGTAESNSDKASGERKIPIIETFKSKKRYTKREKELIKVTRAAMEAIERNQKALKALIKEEKNAEV